MSSHEESPPPRFNGLEGAPYGRRPATEFPIPEPVRAVLALFEGPLSAVQFPQIDQEILAAQVAIVDQRRTELQRALEAVQAARTNLDREQQVLFEQARQAHAYATVYAAAQPELASRIADIKLETRILAPLKKRGRKPKSENQTSLVEPPEDPRAESPSPDIEAGAASEAKRSGSRNASPRKLAVSA